MSRSLVCDLPALGCWMQLASGICSRAKRHANNINNEPTFAFAPYRPRLPTAIGLSERARAHTHKRAIWRSRPAYEPASLAVVLEPPAIYAWRGSGLSPPAPGRAGGDKHRPGSIGPIGKAAAGREKEPLAHTHARCQDVRVQIFSTWPSRSHLCELISVDYIARVIKWKHNRARAQVYIYIYMYIQSKQAAQM